MIHTIYALCVEQERGKYYAFSDNDPSGGILSRVSAHHAIGILMTVLASEGSSFEVDAIHIIEVPNI